MPWSQRLHDAPALRVVPRELALVVHPPACVQLTQGRDGILMCERRRQPGSCPPRGRTARKPQTHRSPVHGSDAVWGGGRNSLFQVRNVEIHPGHGCPSAPVEKKKKSKKNLRATAGAALISVSTQNGGKGGEASPQKNAPFTWCKEYACCPSPVSAVGAFSTCL